jgi:titin
MKQFKYLLLCLSIILIPIQGFANTGIMRGIITSSSACSMPSAPTGVSDTVTSTSLTPSWTAGSGSTSSSVDYGTTTGYGTTVNPATSGTAITGLSASTLYHYRVNAINACGTTNGSDNSDTTSSTPTTEDCATGATKIYCQNFETATTGYDNSESWTTNAVSGCTYNPVDATTPLRGTQSLLITATGAAECFDYPPAFTTTASHSVFTRVNVQSLPSGTTSILKCWNPALSGVVAEIDAQSTGNWIAKHGTTSSTVSGFTVATAYNIWMDYTAGAGSNGTMYVYVAPVATTTKPGTPTISITTGNSNSNTVSCEPDMSGNAATIEYDQWMESNTVMGSVTP